MAAAARRALAAWAARAATSGPCAPSTPLPRPAAAARAFAAKPVHSDDDGVVPGDASTASSRVDRLAADILALNLLEVADLTELLQKRLGVTPGAMSFAAAGAAPAGGGPAGGAPAPPPPAAEEKTEFDVKLEGFDAGDKIKIIKEVRGATDLGLKEAKELVEKAPTVVKAGLKKADAEALLAKLAAAGAKAVLE